jgi:hypothetical protein
MAPDGDVPDGSTDARIDTMQTKAKENSVVTTKYDPEAKKITYTVLGVGDLTLYLSRISEANTLRFVIHGAGQKVVDAAAIPAEPLADTEEGRAAQKLARAQRKFNAMRRIVDHYNSGTDDWSPAREGGVVGLDTTLLAAVSEVLGKDVPKVRELVAAGAEKKGVAQRAYLAKLAENADVAKVVNRLRAEGAGDVDPDEELAGMMGE